MYKMSEQMMAHWATHKVSGAKNFGKYYASMQNTKIAMTVKMFSTALVSLLRYIVNSNVVGVSITGVFTF